MANLSQIQGNQKIVMGWYGSCEDDDCESFSLTSQSVADVIEQVYEIHEDSTKPNIFLSYLYENHPSLAQSLTSLECGHTYYIELKKPNEGADLKSINIPELVIADAGTTTERYVTINDQCGDGSGGGGGVADITFLENSPSDNGDLRISIGADITSLNSLCSSNIWKYKIEVLSDETANSGSIIENWKTAPSVDNQVTILSNYLSETNGGNSWYLISIQGYASDESTAVTDIKTAKVFIEWPTPTLTINNASCNSLHSYNAETQTSVDQSFGPTCATLSVDHLEFEGPSNKSVVSTANGPAVFNLQRYLIKENSIKMTTKVTDFGDAQDSDIFSYKLGTGSFTNLISLETVNIGTDNTISVILTGKDGDGADLPVGDDYQVQLTFEFEGKDNRYDPHFDKYKVSVLVNAEVKERTISITNATDNDNLGVSLSVNLGNVTKWKYRVYDSTGNAVSDVSSVQTGSFTTIPMTSIIQSNGTGEYTIKVFGVGDTDSNLVVTPEDSEKVNMNYPPPTFTISGSINEGYEEESGPSAGNDLLTITHNWVTEYKIFMPENTDTAWQIKKNGESDDKYTTIATTATTYMTRNNQDSAQANVADKFILRLKAGLGVDPYNRNIKINAIAKDGSTITEKTLSVSGKVTTKPPCCDGMPAGNTYNTDGTNDIGVPTESFSGLLLRCSGFDAGGVFCFNDGSSADFEDLYLVKLHDENGQLVGGDPQHGSVNVAGNFSSSKAVVYTPPDGLAYSGTCYRGVLQNKAGSGVNILTADPARDVTTVFGVEK